MSEVFVTDEQRAVIESWGQGMAVVAGAGCGKTTTMVQKCIELRRRKPGARFIAVSFTEKSASDLEAKFSEKLGPDWAGEGSKRSLVKTIHGLCRSIIQMAPEAAGFDGSERLLSEHESRGLWSEALSGLWSLAPNEGNVDVESALDRILARESRTSLEGLLSRVRELEGFGLLSYLRRSSAPHEVDLLHVAEWVLGRYEQLKHKQGVQDFSDLEKGADRALQSTELQRQFHQEFEFVLIDEFQDTNPIQGSILWRIARPDLSNLCVVGDPKQSIYRFRDADVSVFERACAELPLRLRLTKNFRSRPEILEFVNTVCAPLFDASEMQYDALMAGREVTPVGDSNSGAATGVEVWRVLNPVGLAERLRCELQCGRMGSLSDVVVLVRRVRGGTEKWLRGLTQAGIPLAIGSGGRFWEDPRVVEIVSFLRWWHYPGHRLSAATFFRAPWVGVPDAVLDQWWREDPTALAPFLLWDHPLAKHLASLAPRVGGRRAGEWVLDLLVNDAIEAELGSAALGLWHRFEAWSREGKDVFDSIAEASQAIAEKRREKEVPPPKNEGQLQVLTIHGSKGLEFPQVILVDFPPQAQRTTSAPLLYWDREAGACLASRDEEGDRTHEEVEWLERERRHELAEVKRLFYVAVTRPKERLILVLEESQTKEESPKEVARVSKKTEENFWNRDFWQKWVLDSARSGVHYREFQEPEDCPEGTSALTEAAKRNGRAVSTPVFRASDTKTQFRLVRARSSVSQWVTLELKEKKEEGNGAGQDAGIRADGESEVRREIQQWVDRLEKRSADAIGTEVHNFLEKWEEADPEGRLVLEEQLKKLEHHVGQERLMAEGVVEWIRRHQLNPQTEVLREWSFEIPLFGETLVGTFDRVEMVRDPEGRLLRAELIDFKTGMRDQTEDHLRQRYAVQIQWYVLALETLEPNLKDRVVSRIVYFSPHRVQEVEISLKEGWRDGRREFVERVVKSLTS